MAEATATPRWKERLDTTHATGCGFRAGLLSRVWVARWFMGWLDVRWREKVRFLPGFGVGGRGLRVLTPHSSHRASTHLVPRL